MAKQDIIISIQLKGAEGVSKSTDKVANSEKHLREMMSRSAVELEKLNKEETPKGIKRTNS